MYLSDLLPALPVQQQVVIKTEPDLNDSGIGVTPRRQERSTSRIRTHVSFKHFVTKDSIKKDYF